MKKILLGEVLFLIFVAANMGIPEEEQRWQKYGGIVPYLNDQLKLLIRDLNANRVSIANFSISDAVAFTTVLDCPHLDQKLCSELSHLFYGADERARRSDNSLGVFSSGNSVLKIPP